MSETQKTISGRHFIEETVVMDGLDLDACAFHGCRLVYRGGEPPRIRGCRFDGCRWEFEAEAAQTLLFLKGLYHGGFDSVVDNTFSAIRDRSAAPRPVAHTDAPPPADSHGETQTRVSGLTRRLAEFPPIRIVKRPKPGAE